MRKKWLQTAVVTAVLISLSGCSVSERIQPEPSKEETAKEETVPRKPSPNRQYTEETAKEESKEGEKDQEEIFVSPASLSFVTQENAYQPLAFTANAPEYSVAADLSNIENMEQFTNLTEKQREMIAQNGFVVIPTDSEQLFYLYEENTYKNIPNFVTTDSVLQLYHIYYDYALRDVESEYFYEDTVKMNDGLLQELLTEYKEVSDGKVKEAIRKDIAYCVVVQLVLEQPLPDEIDSEISRLAQQEYELIKAAAGFEKSPVTGSRIDYSLFAVRGHYTRSEELTKYFLAFSWYGVNPFTFYQEEGRNEEGALCAMILADALRNTPQAEAVWNNIYAVTGFMVGAADDIIPAEISDLVEKVYGEIPAPDRLPDKLDAFYDGLQELRDAQIVSKQADAEKELQMRFMGQRYIPDSEILQELCDPDDRPYPTGLDVLAVYGSERAKALLDEIYKPTELWSGYQEQYDKLCDKFRNMTIEEQTSNIYTGWLFTLNQIGETKGEGYPFFMRNDAWMNKSLTTALGSWAELRHDTILYGKMSGAECGGGEEPPQIMAYVEPDPEFFNRLCWLTETTRDGLAERGMLSTQMEYKTETMLNLLEFLRNCAVKELSGEELSAEERYSLLVYGGTLEYISSSIAEASNWYLIESDTDRNMAVIADVHTTMTGYMEEGVGHACEIYVAIPQDGKVYLTRGAVFDYYEFVSPARLTDEQWQEMLLTAPPERVPYSETFMDDDGGHEIPVPDQPYSTGC